jgi:hypothetical protein
VLGIHIHEHRRGPHGADRLSGGKEAEGCGDHLIALADAQASQGQHQGIGAAVAAHGVGHTHGGGEGLLKATDHRAPDVLAAAQHLQHGLVELLAERIELRVQAEGGHLHATHTMH